MPENQGDFTNRTESAPLLPCATRLATLIVPDNVRKKSPISRVTMRETGLWLPVSRAAARCRLLLALLPGTAQAELNLQPVILDNTYIAYERDGGDIDGDGGNDLVAIQEGDTTLQLFRAPTWARSTLITFTGNSVDESAGGVPCYRIETAIATYFLERVGAGLASMIDKEGHDWLGFHPTPGNRAGVEFRGFPNAVDNPAGSYFTPKMPAPFLPPQRSNLSRPNG